MTARLRFNQIGPKPGYTELNPSSGGWSGLAIGGVVVGGLVLAAAIVAIVLGAITLDKTNKLYDPANKADRILYVGSTRPFKTISSALDSLRGTPIGNATIFVDPGLYTETVEIGDSYNSPAGYNLYEGSTNIYNVSGLSIVGDQRPFVGVTYVNGRKLSTRLQSRMIITTNVSGVGPFNGFNAEFAQPISVTARGAAVNDGVDDVTDACETPFVGSVAGKIAILQRGVCGFLTKAENAATNGAIAVITYMASAEPPIVMGGGSVGQLPYADVMISNADGNALLTALAANPYMQITIAADYYPIGLKDSIPTFVRPASNQLQILSSGPPINFTALGVVNGDKVTLVADDGGSDTATFLNHYVVQNVSGNTITFTTDITTFAASPYATLTLLPNVVVRMPNKFKAALNVHSANVMLRGITFEDNPAFEPKAGINVGFLNDGRLMLNNVVFDSSNKNVLTSFQAQNGIVFVNSDETSLPYVHDSVTFIGGSVYFYNSQLYSDGGGSVVSVTENIAFSESKIGISDRLQTVFGGSLGLFPNGGLVVLNSQIRVGSLDLAGARGDSANLYMDYGSTLSVFGKTTIDGGNAGGSVFGMYLFGGSQVTFNDDVSFTNMFLPIWLLQGSRLVAGTNVLYDGNEGLKYLVEDSSSMDFTRTTCAPFNQISFGVNASYIDPYFKTQLLTAGNLTMFLDASTTGFVSATDYLFVNPSEYVIINVNGGNHAIKCVSCNFIGDGITGPKSIVNFPAVAGSTITFRAIAPDTVVIVSASSGSTFDTRFLSLPLRNKKRHSLDEMRPKMIQAVNQMHVASSVVGVSSSLKKAQN